MTEYKLIDSSVWVRYLINEEYKEIIESEDIFYISSLSIFEVKKKLLKLNYKTQDILKSLEFIKKKCNILEVTKEISEEAADISFNKNIGMADSIIYITAIKNKAKLLTADNDFRNLENTQVLD